MNDNYDVLNLNEQAIDNFSPEEMVFEIEQAIGDKAFLADINQIKRLSKDEQILLGRKMLDGDSEAKEKLIEATFWVSVGVASKLAADYQLQQADKEDLRSIGFIWLFTNAHKFNPNLDTKFSTFAWFCIRNEMVGHINREREIKSKSTSSQTLPDVLPDPESEKMLDKIATQNLFYQYSCKILTTPGLNARKAVAAMLRIGKYHKKCLVYPEQTLAKSIVNASVREAIEIIRTYYERTDDDKTCSMLLQLAEKERTADRMLITAPKKDASKVSSLLKGVIKGEADALKTKFDKERYL